MDVFLFPLSVFLQKLILYFIKCIDINSYSQGIGSRSRTHLSLKVGVVHLGMLYPHMFLSTTFPAASLQAQRETEKRAGENQAQLQHLICVIVANSETPSV